MSSGRSNSPISVAHMVLWRICIHLSSPVRKCLGHILLCPAYLMFMTFINTVKNSIPFIYNPGGETDVISSLWVDLRGLQTSVTSISIDTRSIAADVLRLYCAFENFGNQGKLSACGERLCNDPCLLKTDSMYWEWGRDAANSIEYLCIPNRLARFHHQRHSSSIIDCSIYSCIDWSSAWAELRPNGHWGQAAPRSRGTISKRPAFSHWSFVFQSLSLQIYFILIRDKICMSTWSTFWAHCANMRWCFALHWQEQ